MTASDGADGGAEDETAEPQDPPVEVELLHGVAVTRSSGQTVLHPSREELLALVAELRSAGYWQCIDVCAVDYLTHPSRPALPATVEPERFEVVVQLLNLNEHARLRLRVQVPEGDPTCPSLSAIHPGAEAPEREAYDLFGISFDGHPDMTRILLPDEWVGHPLRKDESSGRIPVQFKAATNVR